MGTTKARGMGAVKMGNDKEKLEEVRQEMIAQGRDHLENANRLRGRLKVMRDDAISALEASGGDMLAADELIMTWLERLAMMMRIDVTRVMDEGTVRLVWADTDGDPIKDPDTDDFVNVITDFDCISRLVISRKKKKK